MKPAASAPQSCRARLATLLLVLCAMLPASSAGAFTLTWTAASGLEPDQIGFPWTELDSSSTPPALAGGVLTLTTTADAQNLFYRLQDPAVDTSGSMFLEFRVRFVSGSTSAASRAPISVAIAVAANEGLVFFIDQDEIFDLSAAGVRGTTAMQDTDDSFHTYRIEYDGSGGYDVFYDAGLLFSGSTYVSASDHGPTERIFWGEGSIFANGTSEWSFVSTNAAVPEPGIAALLGLGAIGLARLRRG